MPERNPGVWYFNRLKPPPAPKPGNVKLLDLPNELLVHIGHSIEHPRDLFSLLQANRHLSIVLPPVLKRLAAAHGNSTVVRILWAALTHNRTELQSFLETGARATILDKNNRIIHSVPSLSFSTDQIIVHVASIAICRRESPDRNYTGTGLHWAVRAGGGKLVRLFLDAGADLERVDSDRRTPLDLAAAGGNVQLVRALLSKGADRSSRSRFGNTPLHRARDKAHMEAFEALLEEDRADIRYKDGAQLIHAVAAHPFGDDVDAIRTLLLRGAKVTDKDDHGQTALHFAASAGNKQIVRLLLDHGASITDMAAPTSAISLACKGGHIAVANILFDAAPLAFRDRENCSPLHLAIENFNYDDTVARLLKRGFNPNARDSAGVTPLHLVASTGNSRLAAILLEHGADVNVVDGLGWTPLHRAVSRRGKDIEDIAGLLLGVGADVAVLDQRGMTAVHLAVERKDEVLVRLLVLARPGEVEKIGASLLKVAVEGGDPLMVAFVRSVCI